MQAQQKRQPPTPAELRAELPNLPTDWRLVPVGPDKRPIGGEGWFDAKDYSPDEAAAQNGSMPAAWGLKCGPASGVLVLDLDAAGWRESFEKATGHPITDLPPTIGWASGKPDRSAHAFAVDREWWPHLRNRLSWRDDNGATTWELRWDRHQSVVLGAHPETGRYQWLPGRSPSDIPDPAPAPEWLLDLLVIQEHVKAEPVEPTADDAARAVAMLQFLPAAAFSSYDDWLRVGMALHHTDDGLLSTWVEWSRPMPTFDEKECLAKWESFGKGHRGKPATIATLHHFAKEHGYKEPRKTRRAQQKPSRGAAKADPVDRVATAENTAQNGTEPVVGRSGRVLPDEVVRVLPMRIGSMRLNVRTGDVVTPDRTLNANEISRLYLELSRPGETWPKEATADAVAWHAGRNPFDPVRDYLEGITTAALPRDQWDRLDQHLLGIDDPIAARFLPRYLIGAVARVFRPGADARQIPVLIGPQYRGKTALGRILFSKEHWVEGVDDLGRDALLKAHRAWGVELAELDGVTRRSDQERLKGFLSETADTYRRPYDRAPEQHPRRFVFWATSNGAPIRDGTGSTRFVCIRLKDQELPLPWVAKHRDAIWRRALEQYQAGMPWELKGEQERKDLAERNANHAEVDPWGEALTEHLKRRANGPLPVPVRELLQTLNVPMERQTPALAQRVRGIAESLGWEHGRRRQNGGDPKQGLWPPR